MATEQRFRLYACSRPLRYGKGKKAHCFVKIVHPEKGTIDSRGYFSNGSFPEDDPEEGTCNHTGDITTTEWSRVVGVFSSHTGDDYSALSNNCCSVAKKAIESVLHSASILNKLNYGIGTTCSIPPKSLQRVKTENNQ